MTKKHSNLQALLCAPTHGACCTLRVQAMAVGGEKRFAYDSRVTNWHINAMKTIEDARKYGGGNQKPTLTWAKLSDIFLAIKPCVLI
jgi:hypothetical protein